jgi:small multidrug resistance pump
MEISDEELAFPGDCDGGRGGGHFGAEEQRGIRQAAASAMVLAGYGLAFYFLSLALKSIPVGIAHAVWAGLGIVLVAAIAWLFHGQKLDAWALPGMGLIVSGVAVLNLLSKTSAH